MNSYKSKQILVYAPGTKKIIDGQATEDHS